MSNECLACGSKDVDARDVLYLAIPGHIVPGRSSYLLCEKHKHLRYDFSDIYNDDGSRKQINHAAVIARCKKCDCEDGRVAVAPLGYETCKKCCGRGYINEIV